MSKIIIGIDPDCKESGVAFMNPVTKYMETYSLSFFSLYVRLADCRRNLNNIKNVYIEAGWLNQKANFHSHPNQSKQVGERIAKNVGSNHETGRKIVEMCQYLNIPFELIKPTKSKVTPEHFEMLTGLKLKKKDQDMIDAGMLIVGRTK